LWTVRGGKKNSPQWIMKAQVDYGIAWNKKKCKNQTNYNLLVHYLRNITTL
jgi:hypothetical protein